MLLSTSADYYSTAAPSNKTMTIVLGLNRLVRLPAASTTIKKAATATATTSSFWKKQQTQEMHSSGAAVAASSTAPPDRYWKTIPSTGRLQRPIYIAATRQHVGKTTVSLAVLSGLRKRYEKIGFIKPVGQQHVKVESKKSKDNKELRVDKDVELVKEYFQLDHLDYEDMSPILIPGGYTKVCTE